MQQRCFRSRLVPSSSTASSLNLPMRHARVKRFRQSPSFVVRICKPSTGLMPASLARAVPTRDAKCWRQLLGNQRGMRHVAVLWLAWPCFVSQPSMVAASSAAHAAPAALLQTASRCFPRWLRERAGYAQLID